MELPIFNQNGKTVGWIENNVIFNINGEYKAFIEDEAVFNFDAKYLGTFKNGFIREQSGNAVAFVEGATNGPVTPVTEVPPVAPVFPISPIAPIPPTPPIPPIESYSWSDINWQNFLQ